MEDKETKRETETSTCVDGGRKHFIATPSAVLHEIRTGIEETPRPCLLVENVDEYHRLGSVHCTSLHDVRRADRLLLDY
jgi:hypothetical protein